MRITSIIVLFSLYSTIINAAPTAVPTLEKRQETEQDPGFNTNIFDSFKPLEVTASPITREYTLKLAKAELAPDGFSRIVLISNGRYPGLMIRANKGDQIVIHVKNNLSDSTTIHWHAPQGSKCVSDNPLAVYNVEKGKRYRFRIINIGAEAPFTFSIDQHPLRIIEVEVNADKEVNNFWIRATIVKQCIHVTPETINVNSSLNYMITGTLRYNGAPDAYPTTQEWEEKILNCRNVDPNLLKLNPPRPPPANPTDNFTLRITFGIVVDDGVGHALVNGFPFKPELEDPTVNKMMYDTTPSMLKQNQNAFVYDTQNGVVEISLINENMVTHPFHFHGHNFFIMGQGPGKTPDPTQFNLVDPAVRDTVTVAGNSWTVIRYFIDNPGIWAFYDHIEWHIEMGLVGQLIERPSELKSNPIPPKVKGICPLDNDDDDADNNNNTAKKRSLKVYKKYYKRSDIPNNSRHVRYKFMRGSAY
ncbi:unnamed protein product [Rhizophagus irregularis]|nr:unnamed protein product [Rhizophagus irregularis]CAB5373522.1 unnamed protein product [Rhizophagus irregularis]